MKRISSSYSSKVDKHFENRQQIVQLHPAIKSVAKSLRRLGRAAMFVSFVAGLFAIKITDAKLGFAILLPCGLILIAISAYLIKQVKFAKYKFSGREAELFAYVVGGCALIGLIQVLVERFLLQHLR